MREDARYRVYLKVPAMLTLGKSRVTLLLTIDAADTAADLHCLCKTNAVEDPNNDVVRAERVAGKIAARVKFAAAVDNAFAACEMGV